ncbi:hypothetical protein HZ996_09345 [Cryomorphaceae bacterium]|nr:hypothetical protein HZ996_09345 [Cryomorphaceae bacterium]
MISNILILTGPIISGKTSALLDHFGKRSDVRGFLTPDINDLREVHLLPSSKTSKKIPMQSRESSSETLSIGRYHFFRSAFDAMKLEISGMITAPALWNIVDEVGKLEIKGDGLCPELDQVIHHWHRENRSQRLVLVVRKDLVDKAVQKFGLNQASIIQVEDLPLLP